MSTLPTQLDDEVNITRDDVDEDDWGDLLADAVREIREDDIVVINNGFRTWIATDVVEHSYRGNDDEPRDWKRSIRFQSSNNYDENENVWALLFESYPDHYEHALHVLKSSFWYEEDETLPVTSIEVLDMAPDWVVVQRSGSADKYHWPDPTAASRGEAFPACDVVESTQTEPDYRIVQTKILKGSKSACRDCARRYRPHELPVLYCPECGRNLASGVLQGKNVYAVESVRIDCPGCDYAGDVSLGLPDGQLPERTFPDYEGEFQDDH